MVQNGTLSLDATVRTKVRVRVGIEVGSGGADDRTRGHVRVTGFVLPEVLAAIDAVASENEVSRAAVVRKILSSWAAERRSERADEAPSGGSKKRSPRPDWRVITGGLDAE